MTEKDALVFLGMMPCLGSLSSQRKECSRETVCAAQKARHLLVKVSALRDLDGLGPRRGGSPSIQCARVSISVGRIVSPPPLQHLSFSQPACLLLPSGFRGCLISSHGPEKQGAHSDKQMVSLSLWQFSFF